MPTVGIEIDYAAARGALGRVTAGLPDELAKAVLRSAQHAEAVIKRSIQWMKAATKATNASGRGSTGELARSFRATFLGREDLVVGAGAISDLVYARILDEGGVIRPKNKSGALAIPLGKKAIGKWPRHFAKGELFLLKANGKAFLVREKKQRKGMFGPDGLEFMFILKKSQKVTARHYIELAAQAAEPGIVKIMDAAVANLTKEFA